MERDLYPIPEAAYRLGISKSYCYRLADEGVIRTVEIGRRKLVPAQAIHDYIAALADKAGA